MSVFPLGRVKNKGNLPGKSMDGDDIDLAPSWAAKRLGVALTWSWMAAKDINGEVVGPPDPAEGLGSGMTLGELPMPDGVFGVLGGVGGCCCWYAWLCPLPRSAADSIPGENDDEVGGVTDGTLDDGDSWGALGGWGAWFGGGDTDDEGMVAGLVFDLGGVMGTPNKLNGNLAEKKVEKKWFISDPEKKSGCQSSFSGLSIEVECKIAREIFDEKKFGPIFQVEARERFDLASHYRSSTKKFSTSPMPKFYVKFFISIKETVEPIPIEVFELRLKAI